MVPDEAVVNDFRGQRHERSMYSSYVSREIEFNDNM